MPTKAEKEREERINARKLEAKKKDEEKAAKAKKLKDRLGKSKEVTLNARANMLKGGVIVEVINAVQARLAQATGFTAVCPLDFTIKDLEARKMGRLVDPRVTQAIANAVLIPTVAKISIGHDIEADVAVEVGSNFVDECEYAAVGVAGATVFIKNKGAQPVPFICGVTSLAECLKRLKEGAKILRIKQTSAVRVDATLVVLKRILAEVIKYQDEKARKVWLRNSVLEEADFDRVRDAKDLSCLPLYGYGGISTPRDVALMMDMKCSGVFVDNTVFTSDNPRNRLKAIVAAVSSFDDMDKMIDLSIGTGERFI
ncbi:hypothetical protein IWW57_004059 [Coemansia sp. S610]|nr:hypothetical protein IWW57_004059 [Coemansia sp. S610]